MRSIFRLPAARFVHRSVLLSLVVMMMTPLAMAQVRNNNNNNNNNNTGGGLFAQSAVGGVLVGTDGILKSATEDQTGRLQKLMQEAIQQAPADMKAFTPMRKVSLRKLEAVVKDLVENGKPIPNDIYFLSGLQQIQYVFVYPEQKDIVLAGPAEGWTVAHDGTVVGITTGRPVMTLDDLLVAIRSAEGAQRQAISCSIDPQPKNYPKLTRRFAELQDQINQMRRAGMSFQPSENTLQSLEKALGPQKITVTGVPDTSHFARVMVAADFQMKQIAMGLKPSPVRSIPNYMNMLKVGGIKKVNAMPRWWLEPRYSSVVRSPDGLAWELKGSTVKAMTDEEHFKSDGTRERTGRANPIAQRWADLMTKNFDKLAIADPVFGELRNCMELAVVGSLIVREDLNQRAGFDMQTLLEPTAVQVSVFSAPNQVDSKASYVKGRGRGIYSVSGGVQINTPAILKDPKTSPKLTKARTKAEKTETKNWWWN